MPSSVLLLLMVILPIGYAATCTSNEYCPPGWSVKRVGKEYTPMTCEPANPTRKCPKPYTCVASHCQINFCCINQKLLEKLKKEEEDKEEEYGNDEDEL